jgi:hypothetical protein
MSDGGIKRKWSCFLTATRFTNARNSCVALNARSPNIAVRNASEKTGTVAITEIGVTGIVAITLYSQSDFEDVGVILLELAHQNV